MHQSADKGQQPKTQADQEKWAVLKYFSDKYEHYVISIRTK